jgi:hypothetical protein
MALFREFTAAGGRKGNDQVWHNVRWYLLFRGQVKTKGQIRLQETNEVANWCTGM